MNCLKQIQAHIHNRGITMYRLSKMTGLRESTLHDVFNKGNPTLLTLVNICTALDLKIIIQPTNKQQ